MSDEQTVREALQRTHTRDRNLFTGAHPSYCEGCQAEAAFERLLAQRDRDVEQLRHGLQAFFADVRLVVADHWSGLPEHREPAMKAFPRLDEILFADDDGNERPFEDVLARVEALAAVSSGGPEQ